MNSALLRDIVAPPIPVFKAKARKLEPLPFSIIDLSQAVPLQPTSTKIRMALSQALLENDDLSFYTEVEGRADLRKALAENHPLLRDHGPDSIIITAGANHAMYTALTLLLNPGEKVLLPEPFYFNYDMALPMLGLKAAYLPMSSDNGLKLCAATMIQQIQAQAPDIKAIILITPNNPSGACYDPAEIVQLLNWTAPRGIQIIVDETYLKFDPGHLRDQALTRFLGKGLVLVGSFSKSYSLTGYRVGYLGAGLEQIEQAMKIQDTMVICASSVGQLAALIGLQKCEREAQQNIAAVCERTARLVKQLSALRQFRLVSAGAMFAYLRNPACLNYLNGTDAALHLFKNTGILGLPGDVFGQSQHGFVRLSVANVDNQGLDDIIERLLRWDERVAAS